MSVRRLGLFTQGIGPQDYDLPHPQIHPAVIVIAHRALARAFEMMREQGYSLATALEDEITSQLHAILENNLLQKRGNANCGGIDGFDRSLFSSVCRQLPIDNFDGSKMKIAPDLCFKLNAYDEARVLPTQYALFVECKPVDTSHPVGSRYCGVEGLQQFLCGDYAWAMQDAMMVAYAREDRTISGHLVPAMQKQAATLKMLAAPAPVQFPGAAATSTAEALHLSRHDRSFCWRDEKGPAGEIHIYHAWYDAS